MLARLRSRLTYAKVVAAIAVLIALGGGAFAAVSFPASDGKFYACVAKRGGAVRLVGKNRKCRDGEVKTSWNQQGPPGTSIFDSSIPSGKTVTGAWGGRYIAPQQSGTNTYLLSYSFPVRAPVPLSDVAVNTAAHAVAVDPDASCTGSVDTPTAPAGKVCIYIGSTGNASVTGFRLTAPGVAGSSPGDAYGFVVRIIDLGTVGSTATLTALGTWAYTAP